MPLERPNLTITLQHLRTIAQRMADFPAPWLVAGGWAIDCFLGRETRRHEDLEITVPRDRQHAIHERFSDWTRLKIVPRQEGDGDIVPWEPNEYLELPIHQIVLQHPGFEPPEFEFFLNEIEDGEWFFRRNRGIHRPLGEMIVVGPWGIPVVAPEVQLLFKARLHRPKDEADFSSVLPSLGPERSRWLRLALELQNPGHPWIERLP
jgi:hypothetical protein